MNLRKLKSTILHLSTLPLGLVLTSTATPDHTSKINYCPKPESIYYDKKLTGRYTAKTVDGILWRSSITAGLKPTPTIKPLGAIALGNERQAIITCSYQIGFNTLSLKSKIPFTLGKGWQKIINPSGSPFYFCAKSKDCRSIPLRNCKSN